MTDIARQHDFALCCDLGYLQVIRDGSGTELVRLNIRTYQAYSSPPSRLASLTSANVSSLQ